MGKNTRKNKNLKRTIYPTKHFGGQCPSGYGYTQPYIGGGGDKVDVWILEQLLNESIKYTDNNAFDEAYLYFDKASKINKSLNNVYDTQISEILDYIDMIASKYK